MLKRFLPDAYAKDIYTVNYKKLKDSGIKCILIDVDNTITPARDSVFYEELKRHFDKLKKDFKIILFSNNLPKRVNKFGDYYDVDTACISLKPLSFKYKKILRKYGYKPSEVAAIGDQLLTDVQGGNKVKITTVFVEPVSELDGRETYLARKIERRIFEVFEKKDYFKKGRYYD